MEEIFYMKHIHLINSLSLDETTKFTKKATGKYYTDPKIALLMIEKLLPLINSCDKKSYNVADPFSGDGRLITLLIKQWMINGFPDVENTFVLQNVYARSKHLQNLLKVWDSEIDSQY